MLDILSNEITCERKSKHLWKGWGGGLQVAKMGMVGEIQSNDMILAWAW